MSLRGSWEQIGELDRRAAELARSAGGLRLLLGEALAQIDSRNAHHAFGFSSLGAYAAERCNRGLSWTRDAVRTARDLEAFPALRAATLRGSVTWSALGWVLRALRPYAAARAGLDCGVMREAEQRWLARAEHSTVRALVSMVRLAEANDSASGGPPELPSKPGPAEESGPAYSGEKVHAFLCRLPTHVLTLTVREEVAWWFECARSVYERSVSDCPCAARSTENFVLALLAEARTELEGFAPLNEAAVERWGAYVRLLEEWREESERRCDAQRLPLAPVSASDPGVETECVDLASADPQRLDRVVRRLAVALGQRDVELGLLADWLLRAEAWRRFGFASEGHYVRERMGCSYSQWKARRALARRLGDVPLLRGVVLKGDIGLEAAVLLLRVVHDERSEQRWVERARQRTFKHLREEVRVAELGFQQFGRPALPPSEETMQRALVIAGRVKSGEAVLPRDGRMSGARQDDARRAWLALRSELAEVLRADALPGEEEQEGREPDVWRRGAPAGPRRGRVRLRLRLEREEEENLTALCTWCHLEGVHGGRLRVSPPATSMRWRIGTLQPFEVHGRSKLS